MGKDKHIRRPTTRRKSGSNGNTGVTRVAPTYPIIVEDTLEIKRTVLTRRTSKPLRTTVPIGIRPKISHSHSIAKIGHGALDSVATAHFLPITYRGTDHQETTCGRRFPCKREAIVFAHGQEYLHHECDAT